MFDPSKRSQAGQPPNRKRSAPKEGIDRQYRTGQPIQHTASNSSDQMDLEGANANLDPGSRTPDLNDLLIRTGGTPASRQPASTSDSTSDAVLLNASHPPGLPNSSTATHGNLYSPGDNHYLQPASITRPSSRGTPDSPFSQYGDPDQSILEPNPDQLIRGAQNLHSRLVNALQRPEDTRSPSHLLQRRNANGPAPDLSAWRVVTNGPAVDPRYGTSSPYRSSNGHNLESYPSPAGSGAPSPADQPQYQYNVRGMRPLQANNHMPPPLSSPSQYYALANRPSGDQQRPSNGDHRSKKSRNEPDEPSDHANISKGTYQQFVQRSPQQTRMLQAKGSNPESPPDGDHRFPPTPAASAASDELSMSYGKSSPQFSDNSYRDRKMSVQSLLSTPTLGDSGSETTFPGYLSVPATNSFGKVFYGIDRGRADLDLPKNGDYMALQDKKDTLAAISPLFPGSNDDYELPAEFAFGLEASNELAEQATYYSKPVQVYISRSLEPLPTELLENPMNMLYFHHFLDHTARNLVPIDCAENPFRTILPKSMSSSCELHVLY